MDFGLLLDSGDLEEPEGVGALSEAGGIAELSKLTFSALAPKTGNYLGLDISKTSTGIALLEDGVLDTGNLQLKGLGGVHQEVLMRRELKVGLTEALSEVQGGFECIVIEDVFIGENASTSRILFALNTAIDELILDGVIETREFIRVQNGTWKHWLSQADPQGTLKSYNDKVKVEYILADLGIVEEGRGYQDRLDAVGMLTGYFLSQELETLPEDISSPLNLPPLSKMGFCYAGVLDEVEVPSGVPVVAYEGRVSAAGVRRAAALRPGAVHVTPKPVSLGNFAKKIGVDPLPFGGILAFWSEV